MLCEHDNHFYCSSKDKNSSIYYEKPKQRINNFKKLFIIFLILAHVQFFKWDTGYMFYIVQVVQSIKLFTVWQNVSHNFQVCCDLRLRHCIRASITSPTHSNHSLTKQHLRIVSRFSIFPSALFYFKGVILLGVVLLSFLCVIVL